jgi:hypothetical protein
MRWSDQAHGERRWSDKSGLNPAENPTDTISGVPMGHFWSFATQSFDL